jgi:hypothetical protein
MSGHSLEEWLLLFVTALIVILFAFYLVRRFWNYPLNHGPGFFLGVEVAPGFYADEGVRWLKLYRTILLAAYIVEAVALVAILVSGRWSLLPVWAGGTAVFFTSLFFGFAAYTRATLGANPPVRSSAAISLEQRRLGNYISWPAEILMAVIIALCWALLLMHGSAPVHWEAPVVLTYMIIGLLPYKIGIVRGSVRLPSERPEEHRRWIEAHRRHSLLIMDGFFRWFNIVILAGYALQVGWPAAHGVFWLRWLVIGIALAVWLVLVGILVRGSGRLAAMGRDLRPVGSWSGPFRPASLILGGVFGLPYFAAWFGGLVLLLVFFRH